MRPENAVVFSLITAVPARQWHPHLQKSTSWRYIDIISDVKRKHSLTNQSTNVLGRPCIGFLLIRLLSFRVTKYSIQHSVPAPLPLSFSSSQVSDPR
jgi:hypothetical protein